MKQGKSNRIGLLLVMLIATTQSGRQVALACECDSPSSISEELSSAKFVFSGKVIANTTGRKYQFINKFPFITKTWTKGNLTFAVQQVWKGNLTREFTAPDFSCDCCGSFKVGNEYLIYLAEGRNGYGEKILTTFCTRTTELTNAKRDLAILGAGQAPKPAEIPSSLSTIAVLIATLGLPILLLLLFKRKSRKL